MPNELSNADARQLALAEIVPPVPLLADPAATFVALAPVPPPAGFAPVATGEFAGEPPCKVSLRVDDLLTPEPPIPPCVETGLEPFVGCDVSERAPAEVLPVPESEPPLVERMWVPAFPPSLGTGGFVSLELQASVTATVPTAMTADTDR